MQEDTCLNFPYLPATAEDRQEMLKEIGVKTFENLLDHIPKEVRAKALTMKDKGVGATDIARNLGIGRSTVYKILKESDTL